MIIQLVIDGIQLVMYLIQLFMYHRFHPVDNCRLLSAPSCLLLLTIVYSVRAIVKLFLFALLVLIFPKCLTEVFS